MEKEEKDRIREIAKQATTGVADRLVLYWFLGLGLWFLIDQTPVGKWMSELDDTDRADGKRSGLVLRTDYGTGCEYLQTRQGELTPRLDADGKPICRGPR